MSRHTTPRTSVSKTGSAQLVGNVTLTGTSSQITLTQTGQNITFSLPQNIDTGSSPTFTGLTLSGLTLGSVIFAGTGGLISQDNSNFFYTDADDALGLGPSASTDSHTLSGSSMKHRLSLHANKAGTDLTDLAVWNGSTSAAQGPRISMIRNKNTIASPTVIASGDLLGTILAQGYDGTDYEVGARIDFEVDGTPGSNDMPGRIRFYTTPDGSATPAEVARFSADKSFNLYGELQRWLGTQMVIKDVLDRAIITATGVLMTIDFLNLEIVNTIQCDGPIECQDTIDLNKVNGDSIRIVPDNSTVGGQIVAMSFRSTLTLDTASDSVQVVLANGEFKYTTGPTLGIPPIFFQFIPTIRATTTNMSISGSAVYYNQASFIADGVVWTLAGDNFPSFFDGPQFSVANSGSFNATAAYRSYHSGLTVNTGVTLNRRTGFAYANATGAGTLNEQRGLFVAALTKGAVANNPLFINAPDTADASGSLIDGNITMFALAGSYGGGSKVLFMHNAATDPTTNPTAGGILYTSGGALKYRGSSGTVTTLGAA